MSGETNPRPGMQLLANRKDLVPVAFALLGAIDGAAAAVSKNGYTYQPPAASSAISACGTEGQLHELASIGVLQVSTISVIEVTNGLAAPTGRETLWGTTAFTRAWCMMCIVLNKGA